MPDVRPDLRDRDDLDIVLRAFYERAFDDALIGPVFRDVAKMDLDEHLPVIGDFWQKVLLGTGEYRGSTMEVHRRLNRLERLTPEMFERWLAIWWATLDERHSGRVTEQAKAQATRIAGAIQRNIVAAETGLGAGRAELPIVPRRR